MYIKFSHKSIVFLQIQKSKKILQREEGDTGLEGEKLMRFYEEKYGQGSKAGESTSKPSLYLNGISFGNDNKQVHKNRLTKLRITQEISNKEKTNNQINVKIITVFNAVENN